jgi:hypothetical protein
VGLIGSSKIPQIRKIVNRLPVTVSALNSSGPWTVYETDLLRIVVNYRFVDPKQVGFATKLAVHPKVVSHEAYGMPLSP